jgi:membrane protease subunit (stomatin/prohibitin family)
MAFDWLKKLSIKQETQSFFIARPPECADRLIFLHPDRSIPRGAKITIRSDEGALFFREGKIIGKLDTGTHLLDTANIPFLGHLIIDEFSNANHFICELFFVTTREWAQFFHNIDVGQFRDINSRTVV